MPRDGSGQYHAPPGTDGAPDTTIDSTRYNLFIADLEQVLNSPAPIIGGGTGGGTADDALNNLSAEKKNQVVSNYDAMVWMAGSFKSAIGATSAPLATVPFAGICYITDANNITLEARATPTSGTTNGALYVRQKIAGIWSAWATETLGGGGPAGPAGPVGPPGDQWWTGPANPTTVAGAVNGDWYINSTSGDYFELIAGTWTLKGNLKGPIGPTGASGTGAGNVVGPAGATDTHIALFNGTTGTIIKDGGNGVLTGNLSVLGTVNSFGPGGTAAGNNVLAMAGSSNAASLSYMSWSRNAVEKWQLGLDTGGDAFNLYSGAAGNFALTFNQTNGLGQVIGDPTSALGIATKQYVDARPLRSYLAGLTLSTAGGSASFGVAAGVAADSTNAAMMALAAAITKTTAAWAVGSGSGSFDGTGAAPSATVNWYHVHLIRRPDTGVVDVLTSVSATAPTLPTSYTQFRRIGSMKTNTSFQWVGFSQLGDEFLWSTAIQDVNNVAIGVSPLTPILSVPPGVKVGVLTKVGIYNATTNGVSLLVNSPDATSVAVGLERQVTAFTAGAAAIIAVPAIRTNTSAQVRAVADTASSGYFISTYGWNDRRGKDA